MKEKTYDLFYRVPSSHGGHFENPLTDLRAKDAAEARDFYALDVGYYNVVVAESGKFRIADDLLSLVSIQEC